MSATVQEVADKRARVLGILREHGAPSVQLTSAAAVNWYLGGAATHVNLAAGPIVAVEVGHAGDRVLVTSNELDRLSAEVLPAGVEVETRLWYEPLPTPVGAREEELERALRDLRRAFGPGESSRFRTLGAATARVLTDELARATPEQTERALAASVTGALVAEGADPLVVLVAGHSRLGFRHALPTDAALGRRALVTVCARADGLIANASRWIRFGPPTAAEERDDEAIRLVEAEAFAATVPGARLADVLAALAAAYPRHGFDADEWRRHHQGGPAGYAGRDPRATPHTDDVIVVGEHFAWNPSAHGVKIEDTVQLTEGGVEPITVDERWPTVTVDGRARPIALEL